MSRCDNCGKDARHLTKSMTGRDLCPACQDALNTTAQLMLASGSSPSSLGEMISTSGWLARMRQALRRR